jgi:hypothetical protein
MPGDIGDVERRYATLKAQYVNGSLGYNNFITSVNALQIQDENGIYWQISADDGKWVRWNGTTWVSGERPGSRPDGDSVKSLEVPANTGIPGTKTAKPGLATVRFLSMLGKGMATGFFRHIPLMIGTMALIWFIHTVVLVAVRKGMTSGTLDPILASILMVPGNEASGLMFWGLLVGLIISILSKILHGRLQGTVHNITTTPHFIRNSFDKVGFYSLFLVIIGLFGALSIAGIISNILVSIQLCIFLFTTLIAQGESLLAMFLRVMGSDIGRTLHNTPDIGNKGVFWAVAVMAGLFFGFICSILLPVSMTVLPLGLVSVTAGIVLLVILWMTRKEVTGI